jgi:hypothetical protein
MAVIVVVQNSGTSTVWTPAVPSAVVAEIAAALVEIVRRDVRRFASARCSRRRRRGSNDVPSAVDVVFVAMIVTLAARINKAMILAASPALVQRRRNKAGQVARHDDDEEDAAAAMTVVAVAVVAVAATAPQAPPSPSLGGSLSLSLARKRGRRDAGRRGLDRRFACSWRR